MAGSVGIDFFNDGFGYRGPAGSRRTIGQTLTCPPGRGFARVSYNLKLIRYSILPPYVVCFGARDLAMTLSVIDLTRSGK